jgi:hypothetical protein
LLNIYVNGDSIKGALAFRILLDISTYSCEVLLLRELIILLISYVVVNSSVPRNFFWGGSTNSAEDRGQREWGSGGGSPLARGFNQFVNERNPYSD